jgi:hypothetical protein
VVDIYPVDDKTSGKTLDSTPVDTLNIYRLSGDERATLIELYKAHKNIDKVLRQMKKSNRYHADAARILKEEGL